MPNIILECYLLDIDYKTIEGEPYVRLFGVTDEGKHVIAVDRNFKPYFWVRTEEPEEFSKKIMGLESDDFKVLRFSIEKKMFLGKEFRAIKVFVDKPASIRKVTEVIANWDGFVGTYETDISLSKRYLIDKEIVPLTKIRLEGDRTTLYDTDYVFV